MKALLQQNFGWIVLSLAILAHPFIEHSVLPCPGPAPIPIPTPTPGPGPKPIPTPIPPKPPTPFPPASDGVTLGRQYAPVVIATYSDAWSKAADALEKGAKMEDLAKYIQDDWRAERTRAFEANVAPHFAAVLSEGSEPNDAQRAALVTLWRDFAKGLKGGK